MSNGSHDMPWNEVAQWIGLLVALVGAAFAGGRKSRQVDNNTDAIALVREEANGMNDSIDDLRQQTARLDERTRLILSGLDDIKKNNERMEGKIDRLR